MQGARTNKNLDGTGAQAGHQTLVQLWLKIAKAGPGFI